MINPESSTFVINNDVDGAIIQQTITIDVAITNFHEVLSVAQAGAATARLIGDSVLLGSLTN
ncbi:MAG: hypothetical protein HXY23_06760 [Parvularculaceae bacterium]|nr:hypothetical protein [Parvularculaceae bacterium]